VPLHGLFLRRAPENRQSVSAALVPGDSPAPLAEAQTTAEAAVGSSAFRYLTAAFVLSSFAISAVAVHLIPYLLVGGRGADFAALAAGLMGLMQVPGRVVFAAPAPLLPDRYEAPAVFLLQGIGLAVLAATTDAPGVVAAVCLFGMGNGMARSSARQRSPTPTARRSTAASPASLPPVPPARAPSRPSAATSPSTATSRCFGCWSPARWSRHSPPGTPTSGSPARAARCDEPSESATLPGQPT
jgi:hypothetical protein